MTVKFHPQKLNKQYGSLSKITDNYNTCLHASVDGEESNEDPLRNEVLLAIDG